MSQGKRDLPEELLKQLQQLVQNGQVMMVGRVLYTFFCRRWKENEQFAAYYMVKGLRKTSLCS